MWSRLSNTDTAISTSVDLLWRNLLLMRSVITIKDLDSICQN